MPEAARAQERKLHALTQGSPSVTASIADAIVVKDGPLFFLSAPDGRVPLDEGHGYGLYFHECRYLRAYELRVGGAAPRALAADASRGHLALFELASPAVQEQGKRRLRRDTLGVRWERLVDGDALELRDRITVANYALQPATVPLALAFRAGFKDIFDVRGLLRQQPGDVRKPRWHDGALHYEYRGGDARTRTIDVHFSRGVEADGETARLALEIAPRGREVLEVSVRLGERASEEREAPDRDAAPTFGEDGWRAMAQRRADVARDREAAQATVRCDDPFVERLFARSMRDLGMLRTAYAGHAFVAAGVPWFATLFGRDSLLTGYQTLAFDPRVAADSLRALAAYQGTCVDDWTEEQPGKILHVLHTGELAATGAVPGPAYYGTIDATVLFVLLVAQHARWTGDLALYEELRGHVDRALEWIDHYGDLDGDGYLEYAGRAPHGLLNQGWKDSGDAIVNADGSLATPPIALVEVQAYVFRAKRELADLCAHAGETARAERLRAEAERLRARFERDFWSEALGDYVLALQGRAPDKRPVAVVSSNPGHALWCGIASPERARRVAERLLAPDMFSGWGVRTLSARERRYHPIGYHLGTVWPHDNALVAKGLRVYGLDAEAARVVGGIFDAAVHFRHHRLPELFAGFSREEFDVPVRYPVADHPQAWGAGAAPSLLATALGLEADALAGRLHVVRPMLPAHAHWLELRGLHVGGARVDLRFERAGDRTTVDVMGRTPRDGGGDIEVTTEPATSGVIPERGEGA